MGEPPALAKNEDYGSQAHMYATLSCARLGNILVFLL